MNVFHEGYNTASVILFVNTVLIKTWLENNDVRDGHGKLIKWIINLKVEC